MREYVEKLYGWDKAVQQEVFDKGFLPEAFQIIQCNGHNVGMFELVERDEDWFLSRIEILPEFQSKGIGTAILRQMIENARSTDKPLRSQVFKVNPARIFYETLGFLKTGETEKHYQMELLNNRMQRTPGRPLSFDVL